MPSPKKCSPVPPSVSSQSTPDAVSAAASPPPAAPATPSVPPPPQPEVEPEVEPGKRPRRRTPSNAFSEPFLEKLRLALRLLEERSHRAAPTTSSEALLSGSLAVEAVRTSESAPPAWAVVRRSEPVAEGGRAVAVYRYRSEALLAATVLPAVAKASPYHLADKPKRLGYALHVHRHHVGHVARLGAGPAAAERRDVLTSHLHLARHLVANPEALSLLLEAAGPEALPVLGRALARRVEAVLP